MIKVVPASQPRGGGRPCLPGCARWSQAASLLPEGLCPGWHALPRPCLSSGSAEGPHDAGQWIPGGSNARGECTVALGYISPLHSPTRLISMMLIEVKLCRRLSTKAHPTRLPDCKQSLPDWAQEVSECSFTVLHSHLLRASDVDRMNCRQFVECSVEYAALCGGYVPHIQVHKISCTRELTLRWMLIFNIIIHSQASPTQRWALNDLAIAG